MADLKYLPHGNRLLSGKLLADLSDTATTATVNNPPSASKLPTYIEIEYGTDDAEVVRVIGVSGSTITIERGINTGGVGITHSQNDLYKEKITSIAWNKAVDTIESGYLVEDPSYTFTQVSSSSFKITAPGVDRTGMYTPGRTVRLNGSTIVHVLSSSYSNPDTTVTVRETTVPASITSVEIAIGPKNDFSNSAILNYLTTATDGATVTFDLSQSRNWIVTLGGNRTLALSNVVTGMVFMITLKQDGTGSRTVTWWSGISWIDGTVPTLTTTANKADTFGFICTGTNTYYGYIVGQNL
jgi:hypothetical protein